MLKLKTLKFKNIGRFTTLQTIDFTQFEKMMQVDGSNLNTGGSSGAGKSTIFQAHDFLLGINDSPTTVLQSRLTKDPIEVEGEYDYNGVPLILTRGKKGLIINLNGEITEGQSKITEEKLDQIIGMSRDIFSKIVHKKQKSPGFFMELTPKRMYEFLTDCLNLKEERTKLEKVDQDISRLEKLLVSQENEVLLSKQLLESVSTDLSKLVEPAPCSITKESIVALNDKYEKSYALLQKTQQEHIQQNTLLDSQKPVLLPSPTLEKAIQLPPPEQLEIPSERTPKIVELENQINELNSALRQEIDQEKERINSINASIAQKKIEISTKTYTISLASNAKSEAQKCARDIKKIRESICPTCEQNWVTETAKTKEEELLAKLSTYKKQVQEGMVAEQSIAQFKEEIIQLETELTPSNIEKIQSIKDSINQLTRDLKDAKEDVLVIINDIKRKNVSLLQEHTQKQKLINEEISLKNENLSKEVYAQNKKMSDEYSLKVTALREHQARELSLIRGQVELDKSVLDSAVNTLKSYMESMHYYTSVLNAKNENKQHFTDKLKTDTTTHNNTLETLEIAKEMKNIVKTFISHSFDDALEEISEMATKIVRSVPNMANATIQFEPQKETKDGKVKEEVNLMLCSDGEIGIPIKSLSGGERSAVDLSIDLAVIDFIENKTGIGTDFFILDEPFTGMDAPGIEMVLEFLTNLNLDKRLIIVDHNPIIKSLIKDRVMVIREGEYSRVEA